MPIVVGCDPGSGVSSPTGLAAIDVKTKDILWTCNVGTHHLRLHHRLKDISDAIEGLLLTLPSTGNSSTAAKDGCGPVLLCIESFVMRGKGGETLQRMIGSIMSKTPYEFGISEVPNTRMKKVVGGHGRAEKREVAHGVYVWFAGNAKSQRIVEELIRTNQWDQTDALALGIAGHEMEQ